MIIFFSDTNKMLNLHLHTDVLRYLKGEKTFTAPEYIFFLMP